MPMCDMPGIEYPNILAVVDTAESHALIIVSNEGGQGITGATLALK